MIFEELQRAGFGGGYDSVRRYVQRWRRELGSYLQDTPASNAAATEFLVAENEAEYRSGKS